MRTSRWVFILCIATTLAALIAACGSSSTTTGSGSSSSSTTSSTPTSSSSYSNGYGSSTTPTATAAASGSVVIKTATITVKGQSMTVLTNAAGFTLYYFKPDTPTKAVCTGSCAQKWPPLLVTGSATPTSAATLPGKLTVVNSANGNQVQYNGHFLYTYSGDTTAGEANGQGLVGVWFVATPTLAAA